MALGITFDPITRANKLTDNPEDLAFDMNVEGHLRSANEKVNPTYPIYAIVSAPNEPFEALKDKKLRLKVKLINESKHLCIVLADDEQQIIKWETSSIRTVSANTHNHTMEITTRNSTYKFLRVDDITVETVSTDFKPIYYGNGYDKYVFRFDSAMSQQEVEAWLRVNGYLVKHDHAWYDDYSEVRVVDTECFEWEYTRIRAYTD